jgi:site-specific DNA-methyltransferase (adenine-specific)
MQDWHYNWAVQALRVAKPGAHLLAFGGTRTFHRLACAIEDAGWEIRDTIMWVYGSGFPKSHDVSKAIDKMMGVEPHILGPKIRLGDKKPYSGLKVAWDKEGQRYETAPSTPEAKQWEGWGTALKPAWEPVIVARKPLSGTVAANVLRWGTGGINVDACRVEGTPQTTHSIGNVRGTPLHGGGHQTGVVENGAQGRWPANLIHDGSAEVLALFPVTTSPKQYTKTKAGWLTPGSTHEENALQSQEYGDTGSAARFFYCAKASKRDRDDGLEGMEARRTTFADGTGLRNNGDGTPRNQSPSSRNHHPTCKPTSLMRYLVRLVTPPNGLILDPFMGSGTTGKAAMLEGFRFVGIDLDAEYVEIARRRIAHAVSLVPEEVAVCSA